MAMTKELFAQFIEELNETNVEYAPGRWFRKKIGDRIYQLELIDDQRWHDSIESGVEFETKHGVFQLVYYTEEDPIKQECNWYALKIVDADKNGERYRHFIPMTKVVTYHPEVVIPPHEEEHYIFI